MSERRRLPRKYLMFYSRVFDRRTGELVGNLVDLTVEGALLISERPTPEGVVYRLRMELPEGLADRPALDFDASSRWSRPDVDPRFYMTGFQLLDADPAINALIERLVDLYGFREH